MAKIQIKFKDAVIKEVPITQVMLTIGRKPGNDVVIDNQAISGSHARIVEENETYFIEDLNSLNGTFLNGQKVSKYALKNGDIILIGNHTIEFISDKPPDEDAAKSAVRGRSMNETMIIAPADQKKILAATEKVDILGGFLVIEGSTEKRDYLLKDRITTIGKDDSALIRLKGFFAPKVAALVNRRKEGYFITPSSGKDLKVNDQKIAQRYDLKDGDIVEIGDLKMQFYIKEKIAPA
jgi:pSer/pThr/pTyr-binding forkhead associated (FHA) protein